MSWKIRSLKTEGSFIDVQRLRELGPYSFARSVQRLLNHLGFTDVFNIDGRGDGGADVIGRRGGKLWVVQCKWKKSGPVADSAVDEVLNARSLYAADTAVVATNTRFTEKTKRRASLINETSETLRLWGFNELETLFEDEKVCRNRIAEIEFRKYQLEAFNEGLRCLRESNRALLVLATGLGKTVIAGELISSYLQDHPQAKVLVLAHTKELVQQLERALWLHLEKRQPTQLVNQHEKPDRFEGVTVSTIQSALPIVQQGYSPDFVFIDEAHHIGGQGMYADLLSLLRPASKKLAVTATPWRADSYDLVSYFGEPAYSMGISDGMRLGYLSQVDYKLYVDNIDWAMVEEISDHGYSVKDLNRRLFLPQRDEKIRDELLGVWTSVIRPRAIIFCQTIEHAERMAALLRQVPEWSNAAALHSNLPTLRERQKIMLDFRLGNIPVLVAVDVLNEGVDVPDVNIVVFARVTHSRKIFVQQLGRGLRIADDKESVVVLDFVSDIRRVAALLDLKANVEEDDIETKYLPSSHSIVFNDVKAEELMREWIRDAADLETASDETTLNFPQRR